MPCGCFVLGRQEYAAKGVCSWDDTRDMREKSKAMPKWSRFGKRKFASLVE